MEQKIYYFGISGLSDKTPFYRVIKLSKSQIFIEKHRIDLKIKKELYNSELYINLYKHLNLNENDIVMTNNINFVYESRITNFSNNIFATRNSITMDVFIDSIDLMITDSLNISQMINHIEKYINSKTKALCLKH